MESNSTSSELSDLQSAGDDGNDPLAGEPTVEFSAPPAKAATRSSFAIVGGLLITAGVVAFFVFKPAPNTASAAITATGNVNQTITEFLAGGDERVRRMQAMIKDTEKVMQQFLTYPTVAQVPLSDLHTNPFRQSITASAPPPDESAARKRREEDRRNILNAVQNLQLQTIIHSDARRACLINNTLYREGQLVDNFTIERIEPKAVIVRNGPYRFELRMQK